MWDQNILEFYLVVYSERLSQVFLQIVSRLNTTCLVKSDMKLKWGRATSWFVDKMMMAKHNELAVRLSYLNEPFGSFDSNLMVLF